MPLLLLLLADPWDPILLLRMPGPGTRVTRLPRRRQDLLRGQDLLVPLSFFCQPLTQGGDKAVADLAAGRCAQGVLGALLAVQQLAAELPGGPRSEPGDCWLGKLV